MTRLIQKLLGHMKPQNSEMTTRPLPAEPEITLPPDATRSPSAGDDAPPGSQVEPQLIVGCAQSVGKQREHNEDALFTQTTAIANDLNQMPMPFGLFIVADGMGGHRHGEIAAGIAVRALSSHILNKLYLPMLSVKPKPPEESVQEILHDGIQEAHRSILKDAPGGGTTLTAVLILGGQMTVVHVGDSRAYLLTPEGAAHPLTRDHSLVNRLVELGQITLDEAAVHPQRNVLYRALGQGEPVEPDINTFPRPERGQILLCSDGLWGVVPDEQIVELVKSAGSPSLACQALVNAANEAGGPDNITAILVHIPD